MKRDRRGYHAQKTSQPLSVSLHKQGKEKNKGEIDIKLNVF
jgi:hypothetical protein